MYRCIAIHKRVIQASMQFLMNRVSQYFNVIQPNTSILKCMNAVMK